MQGYSKTSYGKRGDLDLDMKNMKKFESSF